MVIPLAARQTGAASFPVPCGLIAPDAAASSQFDEGPDHADRPQVSGLVAQSENLCGDGISTQQQILNC
jgi:hypothetical protein